MSANKLIVFFTLFLLSIMNNAQAEDLSPERQSELIHLLLHDCGSCHGMTLKGGLGPALTPEALSNKPNEFLFQAIINGRKGTPMPPWKGILTETEINWIVATLKDGPVPSTQD